MRANFNVTCTASYATHLNIFIPGGASVVLHSDDMIEGVSIVLCPKCVTELLKQLKREG